MKKQPKLNIIGPAVRQRRNARGWSQAQLARKLQLLGWSVARHSIAKLELQIRRVSDCELLYIAHVLGTRVTALLPSKIAWHMLGAQFKASHRISLFPSRARKV